jgi:hypothetical protein
MYRDEVATLPRQGGVIAVVLTVAIGLSLRHLAARSDQPAAVAAIWFDDIAFASPRLGGALTSDDLRRIETLAMAEVVEAFAGLRLRIAASREGRYRVRVAQRVRDRRFSRDVDVAGQSRGMAGLGGSGEVSFLFLATSADLYATADTSRDALLEAIGRGVGRSVVHELAHQILPRAPLHASRDRASYEYYAAARPEQYFGTLHWATAWPLLEARLGRDPVGRSDVSITAP